MGDIFRNGERKQIFFRTGSFDDGRARFVKAPFDLIIWGEGDVKSEMIVTLGIGGDSEHEAFVNDTEVAYEAQHYRDEFGFLSESIVVEEHELGSGEGWKGVHSFGLV